MPASNVVELPTRDDDDDVILVRTGITLIDADAAVMARRLAEKSWEDRTRFFNNIICESLERMTQMSEVLEEKVDSDTFADQRDIFSEWVFLGMCGRIAETINLLGGIGPQDEPRELEVELRPSCELAAAIFDLSLSPKHRMAARVWAMSESKGRDWYFEAVAGYTPLIAFANLIRIFRPGTAYFDRFGVPDDWEDMSPAAVT